MVGFDLDGTITNCWWSNWGWWQDFVLRKSEKNFFAKRYMKKKLNGAIVKVRPFCPVHIITNRPIWFLNETLSWCVDNKIKVKSISMPDSVLVGQERVIRKAKVINSMKITEFYEDEEDIRLQLIRMCSNTKIFPPEESLARGIATTVRMRYIGTAARLKG